MAHEITKTDHMFSASRLTPWHGLGTVVDEAPNSAMAIKLARLDWEVKQASFSYFDGEKNRAVPGMKVNYRSDNGDSLGVVSDWYNVVQNREAFEFADHLIGEGVRYETAGSIKGGKQVWMLARMPEQNILGDEVFPYLLFASGHDGKTAVQVCMTPIRVVCNNTLNFALNSAVRKWSLSHFKTIHGKLADAQRTLRLAGEYMNNLNDKAEELAAKNLGEIPFGTLSPNCSRPKIPTRKMRESKPTLSDSMIAITPLTLKTSKGPNGDCCWPSVTLRHTSR